MNLNTLLIIIISYLLGAIPTGVIISRIFFGFDIRTQGSGNMGSTNIFRILGTKWGIVVQLTDILKSILAILITKYLFSPIIFSDSLDIATNQTVTLFLAGFSAILGHIFSVFVNFKGGKGVNTALGLILALVPIDAFFAVLVFLLTLFLTGFVSLGSILGAITLPISLLIRYYIFNIEIVGFNIIIWFAVIIALLLTLAHIKNIGRLIRGTESSFEKLKILRRKK